MPQKTSIGLVSRSFESGDVKPLGGNQKYSGGTLTSHQRSGKVVHDGGWKWGAMAAGPSSPSYRFFPVGELTTSPENDFIDQDLLKGKIAALEGTMAAGDFVSSAMKLTVSGCDTSMPRNGEQRHGKATLYWCNEVFALLRSLRRRITRRRARDE
ncbi:hypothetical protein J6590_073170 [Homalodisca vitripennis]|nr:hypothetical protein J6590_073170 [Homalodisca vitripennis]